MSAHTRNRKPEFVVDEKEILGFQAIWNPTAKGRLHTPSCGHY